MFHGTAHVYDLIYEAVGKDYAAESEQIRSLIERRVPEARTLLDVACGTGGHLRHLREAFEVTGVDLDPEMLEQARRFLTDVRLFEGDMCNLDLGETFDAVVCLFSSVGYVEGTDDLDVAVGSMARHVNTGGILVVDGWVRPDAWIDRGHISVDVATADPSVKVARVVRSERTGDCTVLEMHYLIATPDRVDHLVEHHRLTLFEPQAYESAFAKAGLEVEVVESPMPGRDRYVGSTPGERKR
jgi:SAM-dependent methyltransferase